MNPAIQAVELAVFCQDSASQCLYSSSARGTNEIMVLQKMNQHRPENKSKLGDLNRNGIPTEPCKIFVKICNKLYQP